MKMTDWDLVLLGGAVLFGLHWLSKNSNALALSGIDSRDISTNEDLAWGVAHLISLEEHCAENYEISRDPRYLASLRSIREERRQAQGRLLPTNAPGQNWCITKHLLGGSMRFYEVASKMISDGDGRSAEKFLDLSRRMKDSALRVAQMRGDTPQCSVCKGG